MESEEYGEENGLKVTGYSDIVTKHGKRHLMKHIDVFHHMIQRVCIYNPITKNLRRIAFDNVTAIQNLLVQFLYMNYFRTFLTNGFLQTY